METSLFLYKYSQRTGSIFFHNFPSSGAGAVFEHSTPDTKQIDNRRHYTVVDQLTHHPKLEGSYPTAAS
jgi:hypothetical protein